MTDKEYREIMVAYATAPAIMRGAVARGVRPETVAAVMAETNRSIIDRLEEICSLGKGV